MHGAFLWSVHLGLDTPNCAWHIQPMQSRAFNYIIADAYRVELKTVTLFTRLLKEGGLLTTGARGVNAPHMTPLDAARVTVALLATDSPGRAVEMVRRFGGLPFMPERSKGPHPKALRLEPGTTLEQAIERIFLYDFETAQGLFDFAPYVEIQENDRTARIQYGFSDRGAFFKTAQLTEVQKTADRKDLMGIRRSRGVASRELSMVHVWFYVERRDGITWEERFRGCDENGHPLDPAHPWNVDLPFTARPEAGDG